MNVPNYCEVIELAAHLGEKLSDQGLTIATAESCTGGLIGHVITETSGCSMYFMGSAVVYSYDAKEQLLGVDRDIIVSDGAVSERVAQQMARGALDLYGVNIAVAVTGIAGPDGGTADKPVGTVHIHLSAEDGTEDGRLYIWESDRSGNKLLSAQASLSIVLDYLANRNRSRYDS